ncbi:MAG: FkbM family methyltransferase, partial [Phycisphaeraceae bacterium]|nr:FkbM family methyltransferase [Phycisphaeraceae bacterium]
DDASEADSDQVTIATAVGGQTSAALIGVRCMQLDVLLSEQQLADPMLLKIDVEGHEAAVLRGAVDLLRRARPTLLIEVHGPGSLGECVQLLDPMGYDIQSMPLDAAFQRVIEAAVNGQTIQFEGFERMYVLCSAASNAGL